MPQHRISKLTGIIATLYSYHDSDIDALADEILDARKASWRDTMTKLAQQAGFDRAVGQDPSGADLAAMRRQSREDAEGIAETHNKSIEIQIRDLRKDNPRGNRNFYFSNLETWSEERDAWKKPQIALNTNNTTAQVALERFVEANNAQATFVFFGPVPQEQECEDLMKLGVVTEEFAKRNPTPIHINCPHTWETRALIIPRDVDRIFVG